MLKPQVFSSFSEYWHYARCLSTEQRKIIFKSLSSDQKDFLDKAYFKEGWADVFRRNEVNEEIDSLKKDYGYDLIDIRVKALKGKSVYVPTKFWKIAEEQMNKYKPEIIEFAIEGLVAIPCEGNEQVSLVVRDLGDN
jgi:hypothetical protein